MNHARLAAMAAIALGLSLQAPLVGAADPTAGGDVAQWPSDTQSPSDAPRMKHPPTAQMDAATPAGKSADDNAGMTRHPPTAQMDQAVPEQRSPGANEEQSPGANEEQSPNDEEQSPGSTYDNDSQGAAPDEQRQQRDPDASIRV
jgi:hypothetical protein